MSKPTTAAGQALLKAAADNETPIWTGPDMVALETSILAIEQEARRRALADVWSAVDDLFRSSVPQVTMGEVEPRSVRQVGVIDAAMRKETA